MKRAFTLIELLVVIAIIAILAALLFPVFAQAKTAARKTTAISNQKQISLGLLLYINDNDDTYPRQDTCVPASSLNNALNGAPFPTNGVGLHCTAGNYRYRVNHFSWQKYIRPYSRSIQIFEHPLREKDSAVWNLHGEIVGAFALNIGFTGAHDTQGRPEYFQRKNRFPFLGGTQSGFPSPSEAAILLEVPGTTVALSPSMSDDSIHVGNDVTVYPLAVREFWRYKLMKGTVVDCIMRASGLEPDPKKVSGGGVVIGYADGSAKFLLAGEFLARTPPKSEVFGTTGASHTAGWAYGNDCANPPGNLGFFAINTKIDYPMWGFSEL